ncbi:MAG: hypothetical protein Q9167_002164 [Letrouitia subvulpina]
MVALVSFCFLSLGLTAANLLPTIKERATAELSGLEDIGLSTADTDIAAKNLTNYDIPPFKCFDEHDRRADPLTVEDCHNALELLFREPRFRELQKWSRFPPQPGSRMVPDTWPIMGQGGNCVVILDCGTFARFEIIAEDQNSWI